jgi:hypothetical protein
MNMEAKGPSEVFSLDTFFMADDLKLFVYAARPFFKEHKTVESLVGMG